MVLWMATAARTQAKALGKLRCRRFTECLRTTQLVVQFDRGRVKCVYVVVVWWWWCLVLHWLHSFLRGSYAQTIKART